MPMCNLVKNVECQCPPHALSEIVSIEKNAVLDALNSDFKDFEDALQNFSAVENGEIKIILTRNLKDFKKSELAILTPETYLKGIASA